MDERSETGNGLGRGKGRRHLFPSSLADFFLLFPHCGAWFQTKPVSIYKMNPPAVTLPLKIDIEK